MDWIWLSFGLGGLLLVKRQLYNQTTICF